MRGVPADHLAREVALKLVELPVVDNGVQDLVHVVGHAMVGGEKVVQPGSGRRETGTGADAARWRLRLPSPVPGSRSDREPPHQIPQLLQTGRIIVNGVMRHGADLRVRHRPA